MIWTASGIEYEGDQRHVENAQQSIQMTGESKGVVTPADKSQLKGEENKPLTRQGKRKFRGLVARMKYLGQDRSDIHFAVKELSTSMSDLGTRDMITMKRLARYLSTRIRAVTHFKKQKMTETVEAWSDSDWAGCLETRKSTTGGLLKIGSHVVKT